MILKNVIFKRALDVDLAKGIITAAQYDIFNEQHRSAKSDILIHIHYLQKLALDRLIAYDRVKFLHNIHPLSIFPFVFSCLYYISSCAEKRVHRKSDVPFFSHKGIDRLRRM